MSLAKRAHTDKPGNLKGAKRLRLVSATSRVDWSGQKPRPFQFRRRPTPRQAPGDLLRLDQCIMTHDSRLVLG